MENNDYQMPDVRMCTSNSHLENSTEKIKLNKRIENLESKVLLSKIENDKLKTTIEKLETKINNLENHMNKNSVLLSNQIHSLQVDVNSCRFR